jgi:signal peptidase II
MSQTKSAHDDATPRPTAAMWPGAFRSRAAVARLLIVAALGLGIDLVTKVWSFRELRTSEVTYADGSVRVESETYTFLPGWLHFHVTANQGAVFGVGQGNRWVFVGVSVLAVGFLLYLFATSAPRQRVYQVLVGMLLAGVIGNLYDRVVFGYVRDMIYMLPGRTWPAWLADALPTSWEWTRGQIFPWIFNVADSLLCTGVALMLAYSFYTSWKNRHEDPERWEAWDT